jgi:hypothetical protein
MIGSMVLYLGVAIAVAGFILVVRPIPRLGVPD